MAEKTLKVTAAQIEESVEKSHNHSNLSTLNNITSSRMNEWDDKADKEHRHNANEIDGLDNLDVNLSNYYTKTQVDNKIATEIDSIDLSSYAKKTEIPNATSDLTNDSNFATQSFVTNKIAEAQLGGGSGVDLSGYATKDELSTKANISAIPTKTSQLTNDSGFITTIPSEVVTETELNNKKYATETFVTNKIAEASLSGGSVDLSGYATKDDLNNLNIPTKTSQLTNDSNFIKSTDDIDADSLNGKNFSEVMTKEEYDAITDKDPNTIYLISDEENTVGGNVDLSNYYTKGEIDANKANKTHTHAISEITDLAAKIASLETNITNLINTNTTLTNKVTALETKVAELDLQLNPPPTPIVEKMYYGRLSAAEVGIPPVKQYSEITEEMILNGANITVSDPKTLNKESMGRYNSTAEGDYVIVAVPKSRNYTVTQDNGIGGKAPFNEETAGANGIDITIAGVECKLYGQILTSQGEIFVYVD